MTKDFWILTDNGYVMNHDKFILDACCGGRHFWFNKAHPNTIYIDNRQVQKGTLAIRPNFEVQPDIVMDFRALEFADKSFKLVVWGPPHIKRKNIKHYMTLKYGILPPKNWEEILQKGFLECWRVLENNGILVMKWSESDIKVSKVLSLFPEKPLFGHPTGARGKTHWLCFMKIPRGVEA